MYDKFSKIYDKLMEEADYKSWASYIVKLFEKSGVSPVDILDLACGTGNISIMLSKLGYNVIGVDISESMLSIADNKARNAKQSVFFFKQDMRDLNFNKRFDAIICACDGINYLLNDKDLMSTFVGAHKLLNDKGIFIFDISSYYKIKNILGNNVFFEEKDNIFYYWINDFDEDSSLITMDLIFFTPEGKLYNKFEETHIQKAYKEEDIKKHLANSGFTNIKCFDNFSLEKPKLNSERLFFVACKAMEE